MKPQHENSWNCCCRRAFTLVEVVASLMLLGTLLVGILAAHRCHAKQVRGAKARLAAVAAADKLLEGWREQGVWGATSSAGRFAEPSNLMWRWTVTTPAELRRMGAAIGRLDVMSAYSDSQVPLVSVEILTDMAAISTTPQGRTR